MENHPCVVAPLLPRCKVVFDGYKLENSKPSTRPIGNKDKITKLLSFCLSLHSELVAELSQSEVIVPSDDWTGARF